MSIEGQHSNYEALRAEQAGRVEQGQLLTDLTLQSTDMNGMKTFAGTGEQGQQAEIIAYCENQYSGTIPPISQEFGNASTIATLACEANHVFDIGKPS